MEPTTEKGFADLIQKCTTANLWANRRYVKWLKPQPEELLTRTVPSSFPSIRDAGAYLGCRAVVAGYSAASATTCFIPDERLRRHAG